MTQPAETGDAPHRPTWTHWVKRHPLPAFFCLAFAFSWLFWLAPYIAGVQDQAIFRHLVTIGAFGPALAGLLVTAALQDTDPILLRKPTMEQVALAFLATAAVYFICLPYASSQTFATSIGGWIVRGALFLTGALVIASLLAGTPPARRLLLTNSASRTPIFWYAAAFLVYPLLLVAGLVISSGFNAPVESGLSDTGWPRLWLQVIASFIYILFFGGPLSEEPGWRGFALPRLQRVTSPLIASLVIGFVWGIWHFPMHINGFYPSAGMSALPTELALRVLSTILVSVLYTWFFNKTGGNVLVCILLHASFNTASIFIAGTSSTIALMAVLAAILALESKMWQKAAPPPGPA